MGLKTLKQALTSVFADGLDVIVDYLWGSSARTIIVAVAKTVEDAYPVRFVQVGEASREPVEVPAVALRSSAIQIMGSGLKSVPRRNFSKASARPLIWPHTVSSTFLRKSSRLQRSQKTGSSRQATTGIHIERVFVGRRGPAYQQSAKAAKLCVWILAATLPKCVVAWNFGFSMSPPSAASFKNSSSLRA